MPYLEILLPSGHRDKIEVNNNSLLISVLNEVCIKRDLNIDFCYLMYSKNKVDLSIKFGMSKLINNSKLDLIVSPISLVDNVKLDITLQLPNSSRVTNNFVPKSNLWEVLEKCAEVNPEFASLMFVDNPKLTPIVFHLHYQIMGEYCLRNTTLASLGFRSGRYLLQFALKEVSDDEIKMSIETLNANIKRNVKDGQVPSTSNKIQKPQLHTNSEINEVLPVEETNFCEKPFYQNNEQTLPRDFSPFSMFSSNKSMFDSPEEKTKKQQNKRSATLGELLGLDLDHEDNSFVPTQNSFMDFKFPEETAGKNLTNLEKKPKENILLPEENRESVLFHKKPVEQSSIEDELPDSFFEVTENDLRQIIASYRQAAESDSPLLTKALREQLREAKFSEYQRCIIKFHFQDAYVLQSVFKPNETVGDLYDYLNQYFRNSNTGFDLYTTPPKEIFKNKQLTLIKTGLVPMSIIYVSIRAEELCLDNIDLNASIEEETKAHEMVKKWITQKNDRELKQSHMSDSSEPHQSVSKTNKIPKWFIK